MTKYENNEIVNSNENYNNFFNYLFSINDIIQNLVYLKLELPKGSKEIEISSIEKINEFKSLKHLKLYNIKISSQNPFELKLTTLETLTLEDCKNINFKKNIFLHLKTLKLKQSELDKKNPQKSFYKMSNTRKLFTSRKNRRKRL